MRRPRALRAETGEPSCGATSCGGAFDPGSPRAITVSVWDPRAPIPTPGAQRVWMGGGLPPERSPPGPLGGRSGEVRALTALFTPVWAVGGGGLRRPPRPGLGSVWGRYGGELVCSHTCPSAVGGRGTPPPQTAHTWSGGGLGAVCVPSQSGDPPSADPPYPVWGRSAEQFFE